MFHAILLDLLSPPCRKLNSLSDTGIVDSLRAFRGYTTPLTDRLASAANFFEIPQLEMQLNLLAFLLSPVECLLCIGSVAVRARDIMNVHRPRRAQNAPQPRLTFLSPFSRRYIFGWLRKQCKRVKQL